MCDLTKDDVEAILEGGGERQKGSVGQGGGGEDSREESVIPSNSTIKVQTYHFITQEADAEGKPGLPEKTLFLKKKSRREGGQGGCPALLREIPV